MSGYVLLRRGDNPEILALANAPLQRPEKFNKVMLAFVGKLPF